MRYEVRLMPQAQKDLDRFRGKLLDKFENLIMGLYDEPRPRNSRKLRGSGSRWRIRVGDYRILYEIDEHHKLVKVYRIIHRREAYR